MNVSKQANASSVRAAPLKRTRCCAARPPDGPCTKCIARAQEAEHLERTNRDVPSIHRNSSGSGHHVRAQARPHEVAGTEASRHEKPTHDAQFEPGQSAPFAADADSVGATDDAAATDATRATDAPEKQQPVGVGLCITELNLH